MEIYRQYKLIQDIPELNKGTILHWDLWRERYTELSYIGMGDIPKVSYTAEFLEKNSQWFKPIGRAVELYQKFPDDFEGHFDFGELRHNKICRFCFDAQEIIDSKEYKNDATKLIRELYEKKLKELTS